MYCGNTKAKHQAIVEKVPRQCVAQRLAAKLLKSEFYVLEIIFLVHVINAQEVKMDLSKLETLFQRPVATKKWKVQAFLGFANCHH